MTKTTYLKQRLDGVPVRNATRPVILEITDRDVEDSRRRNPRACVAANACKAKVPGVKDVRVHLSRVFILRKGSNVWDRYEAPKSLRSEIIAFDRGGRFEPSTFVLGVPKDYVYKRSAAVKVSKPDMVGASRKRHAKLRHMVIGVRPPA